jgi:hypothetical protein
MKEKRKVYTPATGKISLDDYVALHQAHQKEKARQYWLYQCEKQHGKAERRKFEKEKL